MATNYASNYIAALEDSTRYRLDQAARPVLEGKAKAEMLFHSMQVAKMMGRLDEAKELANELRPLLDYLK